MAYSKDVFEGPQCLIKCEANNRLVVDQDVLDQLAGVKEQLNVIAIAGRYRSGKSYLLTRLAGKYKGFDLGSTVCSKTKGIWAWCVKHPVNADQMLLLLDTEGLGDVEKGDQNHDNHIFTLATLLSSTLVYNMTGVLSYDAILTLKFILALRDFSLKLQTDDGQEMTPDQYLENALGLKLGEGEEIKRFNEPKSFLRKYFKKRKCFTFYPPGMPDVLQNMDNLKDDDLARPFVANTQMFMDYVYNECEPLSLMTGKPVNGRMFACQVKYYVDAIRDGAVPNIQSALESMAIIENTKAVKESVQAYITHMNGKLSLRTLDEKTFQDVDTECKKKAFNVFLNQSMMDKEKKYKKEADFEIGKEYSNFVKRNHEESRKRCNAALNDLHSAIEGKLRLGTYAVAGGYKTYEADREVLKRKYDANTNLGVEKQTMYVEFTDGLSIEEQSILFSDKMTQKEIENEMERKKVEKAKEQNQILEEKLENEKNEREKMKKRHQEELDEIEKKRQIDNETEKIKIAEVVRARDEENKRREKEGFYSWFANTGLDALETVGDGIGSIINFIFH